MYLITEFLNNAIGVVDIEHFYISFIIVFILLCLLVRYIIKIF